MWLYSTEKFKVYFVRLYNTKLYFLAIPAATSKNLLGQEKRGIKFGSFTFG